MHFKNDIHQITYLNLIFKAQCTSDSERCALFYLLALVIEKDKHINDIYNFETKCIKTNCLELEWQTSTTVALIKIAFNLFNFNNKDFSLANELAKLTNYFDELAEAFKIRFNCI